MKKVILIAALAVGLFSTSCRKNWCESEANRLEIECLKAISATDKLALSESDKALRKARINADFLKELEELSKECGGRY